MKIKTIFAIAALMGLLSSFSWAEEIGCLTTTWKLIGANDKVCVYMFRDPDLPKVACYLSQARKGGISGMAGLAEDPAYFSISCSRLGPIDVTKIEEQKTVFTEDTSVLFKDTKVIRFFDKKNEVLVYTAISRKIVTGDPRSSTTTIFVGSDD